MIGLAHPRSLIQKCDAKRPCTTCLLAKTAAECVYDDQRFSYPAGLDSLCDAEGSSAGQKPEDTESVDRPTHALDDGKFVGTLSHFTELTPTYPTLDSMKMATDKNETPDPQCAVARHRSSRTVDRTLREKYTESVDTVPSISVHPSFLFPSIPPDLQVNLSFLGEENLQVRMSEADATDRDMKSCVLGWGFVITNSLSNPSRLWVIVRLLKFGILFSGKKMEALLQGDLSGAVLNRAFVCGSHVLGMMPFVGTDCSPAMVHFNARRVQAAWESLADLFKSRNYQSCLHTAVLVASSHVYLRLPQMALLYIQKCCEFIEKGDLQFVPSRGPPPKFSEDIHETLTALSQTIYWANYLFIMCGGPEPHATAKLETEFRQDLPVSNAISILCRAEPVFYFSIIIQSYSAFVR